jgi:hypothetical protein
MTAKPATVPPLVLNADEIEDSPKPKSRKPRTRKPKVPALLTLLSKPETPTLRQVKALGWGLKRANIDFEWPESTSETLEADAVEMAAHELASYGPEWFATVVAKEATRTDSRPEADIKADIIDGLALRVIRVVGLVEAGVTKGHVTKAIRALKRRSPKASTVLGALGFEAPEVGVAPAKAAGMVEGTTSVSFGVQPSPSPVRALTTTATPKAAQMAAQMATMGKELLAAGMDPSMVASILAQMAA